MNGGGATDVESNVVEDFCPSRVVLLVEEHTDLFFLKEFLLWLQFWYKIWKVLKNDAPTSNAFFSRIGSLTLRHLSLSL